MVDTTASDKPAKRRTYDEALKAQVLAECETPGTSVAKVASAAAELTAWTRMMLRQGALMIKFETVRLAVAPLCIRAVRGTQFYCVRSCSACSGLMSAAP